MSFLGRLDTFVYKAERQVVAAAMAVMAVVVALDVIHHNATRDDGFFRIRTEKLLRAFGSSNAAEQSIPVSTALVSVLTVGALYAVFRTRGVASKPQALGFAAASTAALWGIVALFVYLMPNGLIWGQRLGLTLMIWGGFLGASMAARERRHLALEVGPKLFPESARKWVIALGHLATAVFCLWLGWLASWSISQHFDDWEETGREGAAFTELPIPFWMAYIAIPYSLIVMGFRFLGDAVAAARGQDTSDDEVATFKRLGGVEDAPAAGEVQKS